MTLIIGPINTRERPNDGTKPIRVHIIRQEIVTTKRCEILHVAYMYAHVGYTYRQACEQLLLYCILSRPNSQRRCTCKCLLILQLVSAALQSQRKEWQTAPRGRYNTRKDTIALVAPAYDRNPG